LPRLTGQWKTVRSRTQRKAALRGSIPSVGWGGEARGQSKGGDKPPPPEVFFITPSLDDSGVNDPKPHLPKGLMHQMLLEGRRRWWRRG